MESIGGIYTGNMLEDEDWIMLCLKLTKKYIEFVCGKKDRASILG